MEPFSESDTASSKADDHKDAQWGYDEEEDATSPESDHDNDEHKNQQTHAYSSRASIGSVAMNSSRRL